MLGTKAGTEVASIAELETSESVAGCEPSLLLG